MQVMYYQDSDKPAVIEYSKKIIETNGYCGLFFAAQEAVKGKEFESPDHKVAFVKSVASLILKDRNYKIRMALPNGDFDIEHDTEYRSKGYFEKHPFVEKLVIVVVTFTFTFFGNVYINLSQKRAQQKIDDLQDKQFTALKDSLIQLQREVRIAKSNNNYQLVSPNKKP